MRTIWKYQIPVLTPVVDMPKGARIVHVAWMPETPVDIITVWAEVAMSNDPDDIEQRRFEVYGTGHVIPDTPDPNDPVPEHVGTALALPYVWHLYEARAEQ